MFGEERRLSMKTRMSVGFVTAMVLVVVAGGVTGAGAQSVAPGVRSGAVVAVGTEFRSAKWLCGRKVINNNSEEIAEVSDLILDRGWGGSSM